MGALRVFYRKSDNQIVWYHETRSPGETPAICPTTIEDDLVDIPGKKPDGELPLGGNSSDNGCVEVKEADIDSYFASDTNKVVDGKLKIGKPRPKPKPKPELEPPGTR